MIQCLRRECRCIRVIVIAMAAGLLNLQAGCTGDNNPLDLNPGVYKGEVDPLTQESAAQRDEALAERMQLIQAR